MKIYVRDLRLAIMVIWVCAFNQGCKDKNATPVKKDVTFFKDNGEKIFPTFQFRKAVRDLKSVNYVPLENDYYYYRINLDTSKYSKDTLGFIEQIWAIDMHFDEQNKNDTTAFRVLEYQLDKTQKIDFGYLTRFFGTFIVGDTCKCFPYRKNFYCIESIPCNNKNHILNDSISSNLYHLLQNTYSKE